DKPIFLIGYMGSGKTTLGKRLAAKLNRTWVDIDTFIETKLGLTINLIFAQFGEEYFRTVESEILKQHSSSNIIVSTGGGAPCFFDNMKWMNNIGITVYLQMSTEAILSRIENAKTSRPLLKDLNNSDLKNFVEYQLKERSIYYNQAHIKVDGLSILKAENLNALITQLKNIDLG